ncbi:hypothetical protein [Catalinimonas niigatensis]|uniref:hypothetical protein n=1 Tax=Catalinimonas niigatensis TaxID=1397264 RepID=UPI0026668411|nr:hypothetical protein [Catalinimonas niigatensis]WPP49397.1 hypothetical protein PZB72_22255 [Catalinimonas niigatensis]
MVSDPCRRSQTTSVAHEIPRRQAQTDVYSAYVRCRSLYLQSLSIENHEWGWYTMME